MISLPEDWNTAIIQPILKNGDKQITKITANSISQHGIQNTILARIVNRRPINHAEKLKNFSVNINADFYMLFIGFKQAFHRINRMTITAIFWKCKIPEKVIRIAMMSLRKTVSKVMIQASKSKVIQGDTLSSTIFNIMLSCAIDESEGKRTGHILNRTTQIFEYADDIAIVNKNIYDFSKTN